MAGLKHWAAHHPRKTKAIVWGAVFLCALALAVGVGYRAIGRVDVVAPASGQKPVVVASQGSTALGDKLAELVNEKGNYAISVIEMGDKGRSASANGDKQFTAASTFKLFVAYAVSQQVAAGDLRWSDKIFQDKTVSTCFDEMIAQSNNDCAVAFGEKIGWGDISVMARQIGAMHTQIKAGDHRTTANDLALYLQKLEAGTLLSKEDTARLLNDMKHQIYEGGIPVGVGVLVADKVGFLYGLKHDAGIVYAPKDTYVLVIMTNNSSWEQIADTAKQINGYLTQ